MKKKIEQIQKLRALEENSPYENERKVAGEKADKLFQEVRNTDNRTLSTEEYIEKFELIAEYDAKHPSEELIKIKERAIQRDRRKQILKEMLDMWEKLGGKI